MLFRQEVPDLLGDHRGTALAAADIDGESELARRVPFQVEAYVVCLDGCAIAFRPGHGDLELPRQVRELRMHRRPLPQDLGIGPGIGDLVGGRTREVIGRHVADAIA